MHRHECNTHNHLFTLENQARLFLYYISCKENKCWKSFKIMRKLLFNYLYSHPEIGNFKMWRSRSASGVTRSPWAKAIGRRHPPRSWIRISWARKKHRCRRRRRTIAMVSPNEQSPGSPNVLHHARAQQSPLNGLTLLFLEGWSRWVN
jgi:hypothetical protein